MIMRMKQTTAPASEPISLTEAKLHCRVDNSAEDTIFAMLIQAAREFVETYTRRSLITQTWTAYLDEFPRCRWFYLPKPPLGTVNSVKYYDYDNTLQTLATTSYDVGFNAESPARICLSQTATWPTSIRSRPDAVQILYSCGYGTASSSVPAALRQAMLLLIGHWYENREEEITGTISTRLKVASEALMQTHKVFEAPSYKLLTDAE